MKEPSMKEEKSQKKASGADLPANQQARKKMFSLLISAIALIASTYLIYWFFIGSKYVSTDNAYAAAEMAQITPAIDGIVKTINVVDTQFVKAGDVLVVIDDIDASLALCRAEAEFTRAQADLERAKLDMDRRKALASSGSVSGEELSNAKNAFKVAESTFNFAKAAKDQDQINLERTIIRAPIDGIVARRQVQLGQKVMAGAPLLSIVPLGELYVNANFKEVELRKVKVGQPVELSSDLYGSSVKYQGRVVGFSGGTGSAFALIPAQNATGNWIKVVQRLPVRIALKGEELIKYPLRVGLSMYATIDISE